MHKMLNRKVALVTGGSRGIGAAVVRRLAQEGAHDAFTYSSSRKAARAVVMEASKNGVKVNAYRADAAAPKAQRRSLLGYLRRQNTARYQALVGKLGLRR